jgi:hypothetical protein
MQPGRDASWVDLDETAAEGQLIAPDGHIAGADLFFWRSGMIVVPFIV